MTYEKFVKTLEACSKTPWNNAITTCEEEVHVILFAFYLKNVTQIYNINPYYIYIYIYIVDHKMQVANG
jgi:hypothetical protein